MGLNRDTLTTALELIGSVSIVIGVSMFSIPAGFIVGGILFVTIGALSA